MRFPLIAATIVALSLMACSGPKEPASGTGDKDTPIETPEYAQPAPSDTPLTPKSPENTLIETPEYTGVIISKNGASEFGYIFDQASTSFWEPSVDDISRAEERIRQCLVSVQQDPDDYRKEHAVFILENLKEYQRQYVGIVVDGEKRIWCNYFLSDHPTPDWMRVPVEVLDGGHYYWDIEYVLPKDECTNLYIHGEA
jgi:hypothetical protein